MSRFKTKDELLQHIMDMCHDKHHCLTGEQAKAWAEHELRDVTQQVDSVAKACASRTHALWTNSSAASSESGTLQPQVGGAADGSENATEVPGVVPRPAKKATAASAGKTLKLQLKVSFIQSPNKNRCYIILFSAGWIAIKITRRRGRLRSE